MNLRQLPLCQSITLYANRLTHRTAIFVVKVEDG